MSYYWDHAKGRRVRSSRWEPGPWAGWVICALLAAAPLVGWLWGIGAALVPFLLALAGVWFLTLRSQLKELDEDIYLLMSRHRALGVTPMDGGGFSGGGFGGGGDCGGGGGGGGGGC